jgi:hypothetical protein
VQVDAADAGQDGDQHEEEGEQQDGVRELVAGPWQEVDARLLSLLGTDGRMSIGDLAAREPGVPLSGPNPPVPRRAEPPVSRPSCSPDRIRW